MSFNETQIEKAVQQSLTDAVRLVGSITEDNKERILEKGFELISSYSFKRFGNFGYDDNGKPKEKYSSFAELVNAKYSSAWPVYTRMADFSKLPIKNPFHHVENVNKFVKASLKLFPNVDGFNAGRCLTTFRQIIENIYYNLGTEGLEPQQISFYQYSAMGGTGKSLFLKKLEHFAKKYNLPVCHESIKGRWVGNAFSSNIFGIIDEFFPPKTGYEVEESIIKFNNVIDNVLYEVEYKGKDHYSVQSRCSLFINSNKLPYDTNIRRYGIVRYNEIPFILISKEDTDKYFPEKTEEEWDEILLEAFESCPFGKVFEDIECKNSDNLNDLIFSAKTVVKKLEDTTLLDIHNATIREFATAYLTLANDFGRIDPAAVKKQVFLWRNDIRKAVATGLITPSKRVNGDLDYSKYNWDDISKLPTSEDDIENELNNIDNPFERTKVAFEKFIDPEFKDPDDNPPKKFLSDEPVEGDFPKNFLYKKSEYDTCPTTDKGENTQFIISNPPTMEAIEKTKENPEFAKELAKGENLRKCNFVFEIDPSEEEKAVLKTLSKEERVAKAKEYIEEQKRNVENLPQEVKDSIVSVTESGADSLHVILHTNNEHEESRREIWKYLSDRYFGGKADQQCSNTSRLTPNPNAIRNRKADTKPEFVGQRQNCWYFNKSPKEFDVKWIENQVLRDIEEDRKRREQRAEENYSRDFQHQELTVETLLRRRQSKGRDSAIELLNGNLSHGGDAIGGMMYILSKGWDEYDLRAAVPQMTWTDKEYDDMIKGALRYVGK